MKSGKKYLYPEHLSLTHLQAGIKTGKYVQGKFQRSRENYLEGFIFVDDNESNTILLQGREHVNRAVHGDIVGVELLSKDRWSNPSTVVLQDESVNPDDDEDDKEDEMLVKKDRTKTEAVPTGKVVGIIRRNWRQYCGILQASPIKEATRHLFLPSEKRIPKIRIETRQGESLKNKIIVVAIDGWSRDSKYPHGHYVRTLGDIGDKEAENEVLLLEHDIPHQNFSQAVLACLPKLPWIITEEDEKVRVDLRHIAVCSVDPPGCTDIDDALHCRTLPNGNFEVGVHIADVSHFIKPGTAIDKEASNRGTTVYLVDKRIDMVPDLLSSNLCSLREKEDRFAFSCIWEMTPQAEIVKTNFHKSIICSRAALTYMEAQMKIDDYSIHDELTESLRSLNSLAKILKRQRIENGALTLASSEVRFLVDSETHDPIDVQSKELKETNSMVEEFMLLANISVAHKILEEFPECAVLRRHPEPPPANFDSLIKAAELKGFDISIETGKALADSLDKAVISNNLYFNIMLRMVATRCMTQALYFCSGMVAESDYPHYGLAVPLYTHFTSPIRRYSDVLVHRLLAAAIGADTTYPELLDKIKTQTICNNLNYRHKMGQYAGRASVNLYTHMFFKDRAVDEEGYILFVRENALQILLPRFGMEASLFLKPSNGSPGPVPFQFNEKEPSQTGAGVKLRQFDPVIVRVSIDSSNIQHQKVKLQLVKPEIPGFSVSPNDSCEEPVKKKAKT
ncbi:exosome complex exonuclease RRP44-like [Limulus polyphemus]|uniref:Exosome complex exonuclease RRP44-like n=1 Tax=Limulus polyphemus TaxID=6850 RepID=A0ABM1BIN3_LIMPO|nr:exosome complex exonuclease RRP44-like [Limulus polyphemus]